MFDNSESMLLIQYIALHINVCINTTKLTHHRQVFKQMIEVSNLAVDKSRWVKDKNIHVFMITLIDN